jgi:ATP-dependent protease ClpP protease subunit
MLTTTQIFDQRAVHTDTTTLRIKRRAPRFPSARMLHYLGTVNYATTERTLTAIRELMREAPQKEIVLTITSAGGPTGTAMSFYDIVRSVLKPKLTTIGSGDVDSSGIILFLAGDTRYVTKHTTMLLHMSGRTFDSGKRFTTAEMEAMLREDRLKDAQYAAVVSERSKGRLSHEAVLALMEQQVVLLPEELVSFGLADAVLP